MTSSRSATMLLTFLALLASLLQTGFALKCYVCQNALSNEDCTGPEHELDCDTISTPTTKYDTCQTTVNKDENSESKIFKRCTVGPCSLGSDQSAALGLQCDRSKSSYMCEACCGEDLCNIDGATTTAPSMLLAAFCALVAMLMTSRWALSNGEVIRRP